MNFNINKNRPAGTERFGVHIPEDIRDLIVLLYHSSGYFSIGGICNEKNSLRTV